MTPRPPIMAKLLFPGISVITAGPALGHDMMIDAETLNQVQLLGEASEPVKVLANHSNDIEKIVGMLYGFRIDGNRVRADLELLSNHPDVEYFSELLQKLPDQIGFSISFSGIPEEDENGMRLARVTDLLSVDLVTEAAANASVYSAPVDKTVRLMTENKLAEVTPAAEAAPAAPAAPEAESVKLAEPTLSDINTKLDTILALLASDMSNTPKDEQMSAPVAEPAPEPAPAVEPTPAPVEMAAKVEETKLEAARAVTPLVAQPEATVDPLSQFLSMPQGNERRKFLLENKTTLRALARNRS